MLANVKGKKSKKSKKKLILLVIGSGLALIFFLSAFIVDRHFRKLGYVRSYALAMEKSANGLAKKKLLQRKTSLDRMISEKEYLQELDRKMRWSADLERLIATVVRDGLLLQEAKIKTIKIREIAARRRSRMETLDRIVRLVKNHIFAHDVLPDLRKASKSNQDEISKNLSSKEKALLNRARRDWPARLKSLNELEKIPTVLGTESMQDLQRLETEATKPMPELLPKIIKKLAASIASKAELRRQISDTVNQLYYSYDLVLTDLERRKLIPKKNPAGESWDDVKTKDKKPVQKKAALFPGMSTYDFGPSDCGGKAVTAPSLIKANAALHCLKLKYVRLSHFKKKLVLEKWIPMSRAFFDKNLNYLGAAIRIKPAGYFEYESVSGAIPPAYAYVGDARYGRWLKKKGEENQKESWKFLPQYAFLSGLFWGNRVVSKKAYRAFNLKFRSGSELQKSAVFLDRRRRSPYSVETLFGTDSKRIWKEYKDSRYIRGGLFWIYRADLERRSSYGSSSNRGYRSGSGK